jgi:methylated-DNA-protein-cysteine methyltransferase related protein
MKESIYDLIFDIVRNIPKGRVTSYGAIAKCIGTGGSARLVGWAMNNAHTAKDIPAHRVVNSKGLLTGKHHFGAPDRMQKLLEKEGVKIKDDQVQDFDKVFWDPETLINQ